MRPDFMKLWNFQKPAETEAEFRKLLPAAAAAGDETYYGILLSQLARTLGLQQKFEEAHQILDLAEGKIELGGARVAVYYNLERGRVLNSNNEKEEAKQFFETATKIAIENNEDALAVDAIHMEAITAKDATGKLQKEEEALKLAEHSDEERANKWLGTLYNNIAWSYMDMEQFDKAENLFEKGLAWQLENGKEHTINIAYWTIGRVKRAQQKYDEALIDMQNLLEKKNGNDESGYTYEEIGENLLALNKNEEASKYFKLAYDILSKDSWLQKNESKRLERLKELSAN